AVAANFHVSRTAVLGEGWTRQRRRRVGDGGQRQGGEDEGRLHADSWSLRRNARRRIVAQPPPKPNRRCDERGNWRARLRPSPRLAYRASYSLSGRDQCRWPAALPPY